MEISETLTRAMKNANSFIIENKNMVELLATAFALLHQGHTTTSSFVLILLIMFQLADNAIVHSAGVGSH
jgi:hypothetical protein